MELLDLDALPDRVRANSGPLLLVIGVTLPLVPPANPRLGDVPYNEADSELEVVARTEPAIVVLASRRPVGGEG